MKPACPKCQRFYRMKKSGVHVLEKMPVGGGMKRRVVPGTAEPHFWRPYKLWRADMWECEGCGHRLIAGWGQTQYSEHFWPDFSDELETAKQSGHYFEINDC